MKIAIGSDQFGYEYKKKIIEEFTQKGHQFIDVGTYDTEPVSYPGIAFKAAQKVVSGECERAILICGTGIGMAISANKVNGAYAAVCHDVYSTERSILSNNCNVMCMGALITGPKIVEKLVDLWLSLKFDPSSQSAKKVAEICKIESNCFEVQE